MTDNGTAQLIQDKLDPSSYRVEFINADGGCEIAIFSGPNAFDRAAAFGSGYYNTLKDPEGLFR